MNVFVLVRLWKLGSGCLEPYQCSLQPSAYSPGVGRCCVQGHSRCPQKAPVGDECNCEVCLGEPCFIRVGNLLSRHFASSAPVLCTLSWIMAWKINVSCVWQKKSPLSWSTMTKTKQKLELCSFSYRPSAFPPVFHTGISLMQHVYM